ncbi:integrase core domain-containing protein [[Mycoplasma] testudinis]|uniref:integrase core domain-containing protein n=1 Tax=[Mycoplasma] testudinis TaxID=33924 RepID=UPI000480B4E4|nr:integrase core domain-containing protein [[Mycoplasma] testudinis]
MNYEKLIIPLPKTQKRILSDAEVNECIKNLDRKIGDEINRFLKEESDKHHSQREVTLAESHHMADELITVFDFAKSVYAIAVKKNLSLRKAIAHYQVKYRKRKNYGKNKFYQFRKKLIEFCWNPRSIQKLMRKSKKPKNITLRYNGFVRTEIIQLYKKNDFIQYQLDAEAYKKGERKEKPLRYSYNFNDFVHNLRKGFLPLKTLDGKIPTTLTAKTVRKILIEGGVFLNENKYVKRHHLRHYDIPSWHLQFDVKIIGSKDNKFGIPIYIVDCIDQRTSIPFGQISTQVPNTFLIETMDKAIEYYQKFFPKIFKTRTDHQLSFKRTEALSTGQWNELLAKHDIIHEYSRWGQPQTNGKIERHHRIIDNEFLHILNKCDTMEQVREAYNLWIQNYATQRHATFKSWDKENQKWITRVMVPVEAINFKFYDNPIHQEKLRENA